MYSAQPASSGRLRPYRSAIGPYSAWPNARPMKKIDSVSCAAAVVVRNSCASVGRLGRYISIDSGPKAARQPRIIVSRNVEGRWLLEAMSRPPLARNQVDLLAHLTQVASSKGRF